MATKTPSTPPTTPSQTPPTNGYAPSVPISVYRQLAAELDSTRAQLQSTTQQNHHLIRQNQQLQQEVGRLVQSALAVQTLVGGQPSTPVASPQPTQLSATAPSAPAASTPKPPAAPQPSAAEPMPIPPELPNFDEFFTEQSSEPRPSKTETSSRDMGGLWLTLVIVVVMITAFGAGFLVVRPMLQQNSDR
jgi:uncharacterized membrane protein